MSAWVELIQRQELLRDADLARVLRLAQHADAKGFKEVTTKMREHGG